MLDVTLAAAQRHENLTLFPLVSRGPAELPYELMVDALHAGALRITEVGSGTVPALYAVHEGDAPVLILDGEQLIGARQNRMTNRSILLPAHSKTEIPVSCMEQGRWHFDSDHFAPAQQSSPSKVRRRARETEAAHAAAGTPASHLVLTEAQGGVWDAIADHSRELDAHSHTGALDHLYAARDSDMGAWIPAFPLVDGQIGMLAFLGDRPLGMDVIGCTRLYPRVHERVLRGYVMDALGSRSERRDAASAAAQEYLDSVRDARRVEAPTVGAGEYSVLAGAVVGGELRERGRLVHLSAFPAESRPTHTEIEAAVPTDPIAPPSRRRGRRR